MASALPSLGKYFAYPG